MKPYTVHLVSVVLSSTPTKHTQAYRFDSSKNIAILDVMAFNDANSNGNGLNGNGNGYGNGNDGANIYNSIDGNDGTYNVNGWDDNNGFVNNLGGLHIDDGDTEGDSSAAEEQPALTPTREMIVERYVALHWFERTVPDREELILLNMTTADLMVFDAMCTTHNNHMQIHCDEHKLALQLNRDLVECQHPDHLVTFRLRFAFIVRRYNETVPPAERFYIANIATYEVQNLLDINLPGVGSAISTALVSDVVGIQETPNWETLQRHDTDLAARIGRCLEDHRNHGEGAPHPLLGEYNRHGPVTDASVLETTEPLIPAEGFEDNEEDNGPRPEGGRIST